MAVEKCNTTQVYAWESAVNANVLCTLFNLYHSLGRLSRQQIDIFLIFPRKQVLKFHVNCLLRRQFAKISKIYFLQKKKKKEKYFKMSSAENFTLLSSMQSIKCHVLCMQLHTCNLLWKITHRKLKNMYHFIVLSVYFFHRFVNYIW